MTYSDVGQTDRAAVTQGGTTTEFLTSPLGVTRNNVGSTSSFTMRDTHGNVVGWVDSTGGHWYYLLDGRGSVVAVVSSDGLTRGNRYAYDDWGNQTFTCSACNGGTPLVQPWGYVSGYTDTTKLTKFGTRYYNPGTGTWTQVDPVASQPDYQYVSGNPIDGTDPLGRCFAGLFGDCDNPINNLVTNPGDYGLDLGDVYKVGYQCLQGGLAGAGVGAAVPIIGPIDGAIIGCTLNVTYQTGIRNYLNEIV
jgi:RHS repeat-associated protein